MASFGRVTKYYKVALHIKSIRNMPVTYQIEPAKQYISDVTYACY